ncbi:histone-like nucleoid-structuring protein Lsr2 [Streptomyces rimosus]|uniref:Lsr2 family DNA-binding protein n=1 Tax=Streptomyces rimosus TaxID=1927 RepID=UPI0004C9C3BE|nr:histone-like nucleoid-structuring protein Lsr2 [Streptomyces rimosus]
MFTDMREALDAESLDLNPLGARQHSAASVLVARHARDKDDLADLLGALGLPSTDDDLVRLLPHLPRADTTPTGDPMLTEDPTTYTAVAASMLKNGDDAEHVRTTLGLSADELAAAHRHAAADGNTDEPTPTAASGPGRPADPGADAPPSVDGSLDALLAWGEQHDAKAVQALAARARTTLADLAQRRTTEQAIATAEAEVGRLETELARARQALRQAKSGKPAAPDTEETDTPPSAARRRSAEELAAIRTWARAAGYQVADRGLPSQAVLKAYDAAHQKKGEGD